MPFTATNSIPYSYFYSVLSFSCDFLTDRLMRMRTVHRITSLKKYIFQKVNRCFLIKDHGKCHVVNYEQIVNGNYPGIFFSLINADLETLFSEGITNLNVPNKSNYYCVINLRTFLL